MKAKYWSTKADTVKYGRGFCKGFEFMRKVSRHNLTLLKKIEIASNDAPEWVPISHKCESRATGINMKKQTSFALLKIDLYVSDCMFDCRILIACF